MLRLALAAVAALVLAPSALAAPKGAVFGLRAVGNPKLGYFVYAAPAGSVMRGAVTVSNSGDKPGTVKLYGADATTGSTTGAVYLTDAKPKHVGSWLRLDATTITLKPGQSQKVSFTATVPGSADPGQYVAGVVAEATDRVAGPRSKRKANVQIKVRNLSIVAVQVNVPGPQVARFVVGGAKPGGNRGFQQVLLHLANTGTLLRKPTGTLIIVDAEGKQVGRVEFKLDTFLPHTSVDYPVTLTKALGPGEYRAEVELSYASANGGPVRVSGSPYFAVSKQNVEQVFTSAKPTAAPNLGSGGSGGSGTPAWVWVLVALGALAAAGIGAFLFRRRGGGRTTVAAPGAPDPCVPYHYWDVDYERFVEGAGARRFLHRCRNCGTEVLANSVDDATAQANTLRAR